MFEVLVVAAVPGGFEATSLRAPLTVAAAAVSLAALVSLVAAIDVARALVGAEVLALVLASVTLVAPTAKLLLGAPSGPNALLLRTAALLRALDLGAALERSWRAAALVSPIAPLAVGGVAASALLLARGEPLPGMALAGATAIGALVAHRASATGARRLALRGRAPSVMRRALLQLVLACTVGGLAAAAAPLVPADARGALGMAASVAAMALAVHLSGEVLAIDLRAPLGLARALIDSGARPGAIAMPALLASAAASSALGGVVAIAVTGIARDATLGTVTALSAVSALLGAIAVVVAAPAATAIVPRILLFAAALVLPAVGVASASPLVVAAAAGAAAVAAIAAVLVRLR